MDEFTAYARGRLETTHEPDDDDASPLWTAVAAAAGLGFCVTSWFLLLALMRPGHWSVAEVTAPLWGLTLLGAAVTLSTGVVLGTVSAWDAHCGRRARRS